MVDFADLTNTDFIVDLSAVLGITNDAPRNYISIGISYRF
jgi:hypothetical protein